LDTTRDQLALIGNPNVGKSVIFQHLTGRYVTVSNFAGTTVDVSRGTARDARLDECGVIDTPGVVSLPARSEDELVTTSVILNEPLGSVLQVGDAKNLRRTLLLTAQLAEFGLPTVLALNMRDEAESRGVVVDPELLGELAGVAVQTTVATQDEGVDRLPGMLAEAAPPTLHVDYGQEVEQAIAECEPLLPQHRVAARGIALLWLAGDRSAQSWVGEHAETAAVDSLNELRDELAESLGRPPSAAIQEAQIAWVDSIAPHFTEQRSARRGRVLPTITRMTTHPVFGWPILAGVLYAMYMFVGVFGAGVLVGVFENKIFGEWINPWVTQVVTNVIPFEMVTNLLVGEYGLWTMGMTYALALVLPIVTTFFFAFSILEDSGYLSRMAVMSNRMFTWVGLNGKAVLPMVLGLGCVTMATLTTRILDNKRDRALAILLLALAIPCSAQLGVILGMLGAVSFTAGLIWGSIVLMVLIVVGAIAARVMPGERSTLVIEMPPLRVPVFSNVMTKTLTRLEWYLREVIPLFLLGTAVLFVLNETGALNWLIQAGEPLVTGWLGLPAAASAAFLIGFLRRDFGATGLFVMYGKGMLTPEQVVVAMVTITLFIPCVASVMMIARERGARFAAATTAIVFPIAFFVGGMLHRVLTVIGWGG
jgi:ferrous iron transport protein B